MLFVVYINSLPDVIRSVTCLLFADDTKCCHRISSFSDTILLQNDINSLLTWSHKSKLSFNLSKTLMLRFTNRSTNIIDATYSLDGSPIQSVTSCKDLGVTVSSDLSWTQHYNNITAKAYRQLGLIRRTFNSSISVNAKKLLYISLVRSQLTYCSQIWRPQLIRDIKAFEKVQRRATKFVLNDFTSDYKTGLTRLGLLPLMYYFEYLDITFLLTCLKEPESNFPIFNYIKFSSSNTRSSNCSKLVIHNAKSNLLRHFYFNRVIQLWNFLPPFDLNLSLSTLKRNLKHTLWFYFKEHFSSFNQCTYHLLCPCNKCRLIPPPSNFNPG